MTLTATPAYGRDYQSKAALLTDFEGGKDFKGFSVVGNVDTYFSFRDIDMLRKRFDCIEFRYSKQRKVFLYQL